jgi:predicted NAD-dependent protein-ADP-ribosyltransferase YbiA (DUF1768 family)
MRETKIQYNPSLTVKENAKKNGVSEAAIRYYIKVNHLDRRYDNTLSIIESCREYLKNHPQATKSELHRETKHSLSSIRHYWDYIITGKEYLKFDRKKAKKRLLRQGNSYYATHPSVIQDLLSTEMFNSKILETFCGGGSMAVVIKGNGYEVKSYDIIDSDFEKQEKFFHVDFPKGEYDIISNPPYDESLIKIINRSIEICNQKVAMLMPLLYLSGKDRYNDIFKTNPPVRVYVYKEQIKLAENGEKSQCADSGTNKTTYAWFIWEKGFRGNTELRWLRNGKRPGRDNKIFSDLKKTIKEWITEEHENTTRIEKQKAHIPYPTKQDLYKEEAEQYDSSKNLCYAFRRSEDLRKDVNIPFGNMNQGFPFTMNGIGFHTSESAYICGLFSDGTDRHIKIQKELIAVKNGYDAKKSIRQKYQVIGRADWEEFNVEWMLYVVWNKAKGNEEFRQILLSVPDNAIIIEDVSFQPVKTKDTSAFWGCRNEKEKEFEKKVSKYISLMKLTVNKDQIIDGYMNDFCNAGVFIGHNTMGKILMIVRRCLLDGTEPDIDYDLLNRKNIHLLGQRLTF